VTIRRNLSDAEPLITPTTTASAGWWVRAIAVLLIWRCWSAT